MRRVVVDQCDVRGALQQAVEVVGVDGHLVVDGGQAVCLAYGVGYERGVADALWHIALVARQHQYVVEIQVARLQYAHHLQAYGWLAVEGNAGGGHKLRQEPLQGDDVAV